MWCVFVQDYQNLERSTPNDEIYLAVENLVDLCVVDLQQQGKLVTGSAASKLCVVILPVTTQK